MNCEAQSGIFSSIRVGDEFDVRVKVEGETGKRTKGGAVWWVRTSDGSMVEACEVVLRAAKRASRALAVGDRVRLRTTPSAAGTLIALHDGDAWIDTGTHRATYRLSELVHA